MTIALVNSGIIAGTSVGASLGPIDMAGANLIVLAAGYFDGATIVTGPDDGVNSYTPLTLQDSGGAVCRLYYSLNPNVAAPLTFAFTGTNMFSPLAAYGFSGVKITSPFDTQNGNTNAGSASIQPNAVAPNEDNELIFMATTTDGTFGTPSINLGFSTPPGNVNYNGGISYGLLASYLIQSAAGSVNPTLTLGATVGFAAAVIATFKSEPASSVILMGQSLQ